MQFRTSRKLRLHSLYGSTPTTELVMMQAFSKALINCPNAPSGPGRILIPELAGLQGIPDLVDARIYFIPFGLDLEALAICLKSAAKARVLAALRHGVPRSKAYLERVTGQSHRTLTESIRNLSGAGLVEVHGSASFSLSHPLPWSMVEVVTYEGKLFDWRQALRQSISYRSFSHSVRVVMPSASAKRARQAEETFRSNGIGLIAVEDDGSIRIEIRSRKRRPANRRLYLMAVGAVVNRYLEERG